MQSQLSVPGSDQPAEAQGENRWLTPLSAENQDALDDLLVAMETSGRRLGIFIAVCDDSQPRSEIIKRYEQALSPDFCHYRLTLNHAEPGLKALPTEQVKGDEYLQQGGPAVMTILGSDQLLGLGLGQKRSEQKTFFRSRKPSWLLKSVPLKHRGLFSLASC